MDVGDVSVSDAKCCFCADQMAAGKYSLITDGENVSGCRISRPAPSL